MQDETAVLPAPKRTAWNKGKLIGAKPPLLAKHAGSIRTKLQILNNDQRRWVLSHRTIRIGERNFDNIPQIKGRHRRGRHSPKPIRQMSQTDHRTVCESLWLQ
jgi:hypothetical protein